MPFKKLFNVNLQKSKPRTEHTTISVGLVTLKTSITFMERRTLAMAINSMKGELTVKVPLRVTMEETMKFIRDRESWLIKKIELGKERASNHTEREYKDGSKHLLLGKTFTLSVIESNRRVQPHFEDGILTLHAPTKEHIKPVLRRWYAKNAPILFGNITTPITTDFFIRYSKSPTSMEYKFVTSYWGVCTSQGCIRLNIELIRAPKECIEYIMAHELCHLIHQNHSAKFYGLLTEFMPDWKERKQLLDKTITCNY